MAQRDVFRRYLEAGVAFTELTRSRAEQIVKDLVKAGEVPRKRAEETIDDLVERSKQNSEMLVALVQAQVREQLSSLGLATKDDIARLEAQIAGGAATGAAPSTSRLTVASAPVGAGGKPAPDLAAAKAARKTAPKKTGSTARKAVKKTAGAKSAKKG
jgi:polyhydroxyalkanoate synthesis regulator phasin